MRAGYEDVVLLTGFPSFRARRMCAELLKSPTRFIHCVVRAKFAEAAKEAASALEPAQRERIAFTEGDVASIDMGLSAAELRKLTKEIDCIHHVAQVTYMGIDRAAAEHVNVGGAREVLEVAEMCTSLRCLVVHSSASVSGDRRGVVREDDLMVGQSFRNVVEETLARAEKMMREAMPHLPIAVVRPGVVVGDSTSGEVDRLEGPYFLILLMLTSPADMPLPLLGRGNAHMHLVPIDWVSKVARIIGDDTDSPGKTFHVVDPAPVTVLRVFDLVAHAAGRQAPRGAIPANLTKALLMSPGIERFVRSPRAFVETLATAVHYTMDNTTRALKGTLDCPPFESYVDKLVSHVDTRMVERRKRRDEVNDPLV